jgi:hypothetical protein
MRSSMRWRLGGTVSRKSGCRRVIIHHWFSKRVLPSSVCIVQEAGSQRLGRLPHLSIDLGR